MDNRAHLHQWEIGIAPVAVIMISLNEGHNLEAVLENLKGWAQEVFLVDSYSQDDTIDIALRYGVHVVQRKFRGFGDQWNFALKELPITAQWTMKLDPDERVSNELKREIIAAISKNISDGIIVTRRLWFMERPIGVKQQVLRIWRTNNASFKDVTVNEHPIVKGELINLHGEIEHRDSPNLEHWLEKQNRYSTAEAISTYNKANFSDIPKLLGTPLQRRMWLKKYFYRFPLAYFFLFLYHWVWQGAWKAGWVGFTWARLRVYVMRVRRYKLKEMEITGRLPSNRYYGPGQPDKRVPQYS